MAALPTPWAALKVPNSLESGEMGSRVPHSCESKPVSALIPEYA